MERRSGRFALVSGASSGIGAAIAKELVLRGMNVIGCGRSFEKLVNVLMTDEVLNAPGPGDIGVLQVDLAKEDEIMKMFEDFRTRCIIIDVCINNAGVGHISPLLSGKTEEWKDMFEVNVMGLCVCTREAVKLMKENLTSEGQIINIGSIGAHIFPDSPDQAGFNFYRGTKSMVRVVTEGLRQEVRAIDTPIRVALSMNLMMQRTCRASVLELWKLNSSTKT